MLLTLGESLPDAFTDDNQKETSDSVDNKPAMKQGKMNSLLPLIFNPLSLTAQTRNVGFC